MPINGSARYGGNKCVPLDYRAFLVACLTAGLVTALILGQGEANDKGVEVQVWGTERGAEIHLWRLSAEEALDVRLVTPTPKVDARLTAPPSAETPVIEGYSDESIREATTDIRGIICSFSWPQGCSYWIGLAMCESSLRPTAVGSGGWYVGLFQVWIGHNYPADWLSDSYNNTLAAWELSDGGRVTSPWPHCP